LEKAENMFLKSLETNKELGYKEGMAISYSNLGNIYTHKDLQKAKDMFLKSLEIDESMGNKEGIANDYGNLGSIHLMCDELQKAENILLKSLQLFKEMGTENSENAKLFQRNLDMLREMKNKK